METHPNYEVDLMATVHRLEAKVDIALTQTQARVDEQGRMLASVIADIGALENRMSTAESLRGGGFARLEMAEKQLAALLERRPPQWPAMMSALVSTLTFVMFVSALLYLGPGT